MRDLKYKGGRNYLHGSDFFVEISRFFNEHYNGYIESLTFKSFAKRQCDLLFEKPESKKQPTIGYGVWRKENGEKIPFWIVESERQVMDRYEFMEEKITSSAEIKVESITGKCCNEFTTIENVIALTKSLNYHLSPEVDGKWVFGQVNLTKSLPNDFSIIRIDRVSVTKNKFSRNKIKVDEKAYGEIRFIVGKP